MWVDKKETGMRRSKVCSILMEGVLFRLLLGVGAGVLRQGAATQGSHLFCALYCPRVRERTATRTVPGSGTNQEAAGDLTMHSNN